jgi:hypothetical protein
MKAADIVVLVAAVIACMAAVVGVAAAVVLVGQVRRLERGIEALRTETVPLVQQAREAVGLANSEMARVEAVLEDTEAVTATVDAASRLAQRTFTNPVVKVLALRAGTVGGLRRLRQPAGPVTERTTAPRRAQERSNGGRKR